MFENIKISIIEAKTAKEWITKYHYSHRPGPIKYAFGIFHKTEANSFFDGDNYDLIGVCTYGHPVGFRTIKSIVSTLESHEALELTRLHINDGYEKNIESYVLGQTFKWLKKNAPDVKVLVSYSDPEYGHSGVIYQATNWLYQGCGYSKLMPDYFIKISGEEEWTHSRTVGERYGEKNLNKLARKIGKVFYRKEQSSKHRYIYFLCGKGERKRLVDSLKHPVVSYPKDRTPWPAPIEKIYIEDDTLVVKQLEDSERRKIL